MRAEEESYTAAFANPFRKITYLASIGATYLGSMYASLCRCYIPLMGIGPPWVAEAPVVSFKYALSLDFTNHGTC